MRSADTVEVDIDGALAAVATVAQRWGRVDLSQELTGDRQRLATTDRYVVVVGEFGKGKSTLVNTLLGTGVCGVNDGESTTVPVLVQFGVDPGAVLIDRPRSDHAAGEAREMVELNGVARTSTERPPAGIERSVQVQLTNELLRDGLVLIDTPGVGGGLAGARSGIALRALANADAVLFVTDASQELTGPEVAFLRQVAAVCPDVVCVLTKIDFYPEWRRIKVIDEQHLTSAGLSVDILPLSAPLRLLAQRSADTDLDQFSGYPRLIAELSGRTVGQAQRGGRRRAVERMRSCLNQILNQAAAEQASLTGPPDPQMAQGWQRAKAEADRLRGASAQWQQLLADRGAELVSAAELDLSLRMRGLRSEVAGRIESTDPATSWAAMEPWLYARSNEVVLAHYDALRSQADDLVSDVGDLFGREVADLDEQLDRAVARPSSRSGGLAATTGTRVPWSEVAIHAARGTSLGVAVTHAAILLPGLTLLSVLPVTALVAVVLGRRMVRSARDAQLKVRRAEAMRAVLAYLDEAELMARKDSRDTVRRVQQRVRDYFTGLALEMQRSAAASLQAVERGMNADAETRANRLRQLTLDLQGLRPLVASVDQLAANLPAPLDLPHRTLAGDAARTDVPISGLRS